MPRRAWKPVEHLPGAGCVDVKPDYLFILSWQDPILRVHEILALIPPDLDLADDAHGNGGSSKSGVREEYLIWTPGRSTVSTCGVG
jgi:hypothetical protein